MLLQLLETNFAPRETAVSSAGPRSGGGSLFASIRSIVQFGQMADTISMSREVSPTQSSPLGDSGGAPEGSVPTSLVPFWLKTFRQPASGDEVLAPHTSNPNSDR